MRVAVVGGTGVLGRAAVTSLVGAGYDVVAGYRHRGGDRIVQQLGAGAASVDAFDTGSLVRLFEGCQAVVNLATRIPVGLAALRPGAWHANDALRTRGVENLTAAARVAGVRRIVQESVSFVYADHGADWVTEQDPIDITPATEPVAVAESQVLDFADGPRAGVLLRFGTLTGDDPITRFRLAATRRGRRIGLGGPDGWAHVVHLDDIGSAVVAALHAPSGRYNVGAEPVLRRDLLAGYAAAAGVERAGFLGPVGRRLAGARLEPLARSLRVSSEHFAASTGWTPVRPHFEPSWLDAAAARDVEESSR